MMNNPAISIAPRHPEPDSGSHKSKQPGTSELITGNGRMRFRVKPGMTQ
ncbi:hypothetical protein [Salegentibacter sediminis]|nr:hypothetical protein [Salegentibacter sediminis]